MGGSAACIPVYLNATEEEIGARTGDGMSLVPAFKRQTDPRFTLTTPKLQPPSPCSVTLLGPDPNCNMRTCVHTRHRCMLSNKGAGTREDRAEPGRAGLSESAFPLPPSHAGRQATYGSTWPRGQKPTCAHLGKACQNMLTFSLIPQRENYTAKESGR